MDDSFDGLGLTGRKHEISRWKFRHADLILLTFLSSFQFFSDHCRTKINPNESTGSTRREIPTGHERRQIVKIT